MATRIVRTSDISGEDLTDTDGPTLFSLDGINYEIDLTSTEAQELRDTLATYIGAGRKIKGSAQALRTKPLKTGPDPKAVRAWAEEQGLETPARGRIPAEIIDLYNNR